MSSSLFKNIKHRSSKILISKLMCTTNKAWCVLIFVLVLLCFVLIFVFVPIVSSFLDDRRHYVMVSCKSVTPSPSPSGFAKYTAKYTANDSRGSS